MIKKLCCYLFPLISIGLILLAGCAAPELEPTSVGTEQTPIPLLKMEMTVLEDRPEFINAVRPPEYYRIPLSLYNYQPEGLVFHKVRDYDLADLSSIEYGFQSSICINLFALPLIQEGDRLGVGSEIIGEVVVETEEMTDRMELFVDGRSVETGASEQSGILFVLPTQEPKGPRTDFVEDGDYCWKVPLNVGIHEVAFRFHQTSGNIKAYTWHFEIVER